MISLGIDLGLLVEDAARPPKPLANGTEAEWAKWNETHFGDKTKTLDSNYWQMIFKNISFPWRTLVTKVLTQKFVHDILLF